MRKLALFAFGFAAAIFLAMYALGEHVIVLASTAGTIAVLLSFSYLKRYKAIVLTMFAIFAGALWWILYSTVVYEPAAALYNKQQTASFIVLDYPENYAYSSRIYVNTETGYKANLRLYDKIDLKPGDRITLPVSFEKPQETRDFDFYLYYRSKGIFLDASQAGPVITERCDKTPLSLLPTEIRHSINRRLGMLFSGDEKGLISGLLTGDKSEISQGFQFALSSAGMSHIISVSGMHVSFLVGCILFVGRKRRAASFIAIPAIVFFAVMTGASPSAVRACIMQSMMLISVLVGRENDALTSLSAALLFLLIINPFSIADIGLQLSFLSTLGIILFSPRISEWLSARMPKRIRRNFIIRFINGTLAATFSATLLTSLPVALYFGRISLIAPLSNLCSLWMVTAVFTIGILCVILSFIYMPLAGLAAIPINFGLKYIKAVSYLSVRVPFSSLNTDDPYIAFWLIFASIVVFVWITGDKNRLQSILSICMTVSALALVLLFSELSMLSADMVFTVLDVGQGQALVATSGAYTAMIDCGGDRWPGAGNIAVGYLLGKNRRRIDLLMLTHNHADHVNGLEDLMEHVEIGCAALPDTEACEETAEFLREHGVEVISVSENLIADMGRCRIKLFRPIVKKSGDEEAMCILLSSGDFDILVTGDSAFISERILIEREKLPDIELYIAGHHGSKQSSGDALLDTVKPETAVISVGQNSYGHPSTETVSRLEQRGIHIYRTDKQGSIEIKVKG
mgnify:FL=1